MPSTAYIEYQKNLKDVHRLVLLHKSQSGHKPGKRSLGHITRGGLLMLCAAWERYVETVALEGATFLTHRLPTHAALPPTPRQKVTDYVNSAKNAWSVAQLATPTWITIYLEMLEKRTDALNTPKHENLQLLFEHFLDVPDIAAFWSVPSTEVDAFVKLRGEVAHRGGQSQYIHFGRLTQLEQAVSEWVVSTDNGLSDHLGVLVAPHRRPWNRIR